MNSRYLKKYGFTLIELLITSTMVIFIGLGVYKTFLSGLDIWQWQKANVSRGNVVIFFEKVSYDLKNCFNLNYDDFRGKERELSFFAHDTDFSLLSLKKVKAEGIHSSNILHKIEYEFMEDRSEIRRRYYAYGEKSPISDKVVLSDVKSAEFRYYSRIDGDGEMEGSSTWKGAIPAIVEVGVSIVDKNEKIKFYKQNIGLPLGV